MARTPRVAAAASLTGGGRTHGSVTVAQQATATAAPEVVGEAGIPGWTFAVLQIQDPYVGEVTRPRQPPAGTRYVGVEVRITNASDQPLAFATNDVQARDVDGIPYAAGQVTGREAGLVSQNLPDGERARGWVWFAVAENVPLAEIRFVGPAPVFRIGLA